MDERNGEAEERGNLVQDGIKKKERLEGGFGSGGVEERSREKDRGSGGRGLNIKKTKKSGAGREKTKEEIRRGIWKCRKRERD